MSRGNGLTRQALPEFGRQNPPETRLEPRSVTHPACAAYVTRSLCPPQAAPSVEPQM